MKYSEMLLILGIESNFQQTNFPHLLQQCGYTS